MADLLWWHRPGQAVVCVDDEPATCGVRLLKKGRVYVILRVWIVADGIVSLAVDDASSWRATRFRPVRETSIESLRALLTPTPDQARPFFREMIKEAADA